LLFVVCCCPKKIASPQTGTPLDKTKSKDSML
jgi:hypothetical protein